MKSRKVKKRKLVIAIFTALFLLLPISSTIYAVPSKSKNVITPETMKEWDNGAKVTKESSGTGSSYKASVTADTTGLKKGYYSIFLYDNTKRNIEAYDGISFNIKNLNKMEMKINLTLTVDSKTSAVMTDSSYAILEASDKSICKTVVPSYGTIQIPAGFDGTVYVPFSRLYTSDGKKVSLTNIQSWGITTVMSENKQIKYEIGDFEFLKGSIDSMKDSYYLITLTGSSKINVPNAGSLIELYEAKVKDLEGNEIKEPATFYLKNNVSGASLSKDGKLEVNENCTASVITVCAKLENSVDSGEIEISMHRSSTTASAGIPKASDLQRITTATDLKLDKLLNVIRFASVIIALFLFAIFYNWFSEAKNNYIKIKNKLYNLSDYDEGEEKL